MILTRIEIENFKQYGGEHELDIPSNATIGVIGANGVGKTTLFEAIEWCLYSPGRLTSRDIRPRGRQSKTRVAVTLEARDGRLYLVERELKRSSSATATIFQVEADGDEQVIVQGPRQVTEYVEKHLIGLSHKAFMATFFTRQKELHFFGELGPTDRRIEVGRMLGLEAIRKAKDDITEERKRVEADAKSLQRQYEDQAGDRDFAMELSAAEVNVTEATAALVQATAEQASTTEQLAVSEAKLNEIEALRQRDQEHAQRISTTEHEISAATTRQGDIATHLQYLTDRERELGELRPLAERKATDQQRLQELETLRERHQRQQNLVQQQESADRQRDEVFKRVRAVVNGDASAIQQTFALDMWGWSEAAEREPVLALQQLRTSAERVVVEAENRTARALQQASALHQAHTTLSNDLQRYENARDQLRQQLEELEREGTAQDRLAKLDQTRHEVQERIAATAAKLETITREQEQTRGLIGNLEHAHFGEACPTCARPFTPGDAEIVLHSLRERLNTSQQDSASLHRERTEAEQAIKQLEADRKALQHQDRECTTLRGRLAHSIEHIREKDREVTQAEQNLNEHLTAFELTAIPDPTALATAERRVELARTVQMHVGTLTNLEQTLQDTLSQREATSAELEALGEVVYDREVHEQATQAHHESNRAEASLLQITRELEQKPALEQETAALTDKLAQLHEQLETQQGERAQIGFSTDALAQAQQDVRERREAERASLERQHTADAELSGAKTKRNEVQRDHERLQHLTTEAQRLQREHDDLKHMVDEFTEFQKFASGRLTPQLADLTSELVREVTDGRYDRVLFDEDFGLNVVTSADEHYPLATFSGGERDVISLSARLALSRMIGDRAAHPPGFLVLDEVFGSLDRDRRTRLLEVFGALTGTSANFQQVFIISHVDDVRQSPIFDDIWQVEERSPGESEVSALPPGTEIGDL